MNPLLLLAGSETGRRAAGAIEESGVAVQVLGSDQAPEAAAFDRPLALFVIDGPESALGLAGVAHGIGFHRSLLPDLRGPEPVARALLAGRAETGVSAYRLAPEPLRGPVVAREPLRIRTRETDLTLRERLDKKLVELAVRLAGDALVGTLPAGEPQDESRAESADPLTDADARIEWQTMGSARIDLAVRAHQGGARRAWCVQQGRRLLLLRVEVSPGSGAPGEVTAAGPGGVRVATRDGGLRILRAAREDGTEIPPAEFPRELFVGSRLA